MCADTDSLRRITATCHSISPLIAGRNSVMAHSWSPTIPWRYVSALALLVSFQSAIASNSAIESEQLAAVQRQLDLIDRLTEQSEHLLREPEARYHFDYGRLRADIERVRTGINGYLTPQRAQPRDPDELLGDYRIESDKAP
jgi:RAQPRD family integrative conjugative element protein